MPYPSPCMTSMRIRRLPLVQQHQHQHPHRVGGCSPRSYPCGGGLGRVAVLCRVKGPERVSGSRLAQRRVEWPGARAGAPWQEGPF